MQSRMSKASLIVVLLAVALPGIAPADDGAAAQANLAQQANNPIANLISVPLQFDLNTDVGPRDRDQHVLSIQPVIPFELSDDWLLVTRWVLPVISNPDVDGGRTFGLGDLNPAFFFVPSAKLTGWSENLLIGVGPNLQVPSATDS